MGVRKLDAVECEHGLDGLLDRLLGVEANAGIRDTGARRQILSHSVIVDRASEQHASNFDGVAITLPAGDPRTAPRGSRCVRVAPMLRLPQHFTTMTSANTLRAFQCPTHRTDSLARCSTGRLDHEKVQIALRARPRLEAWDPKRITRLPAGAAFNSRRPASAMTVSLNMGPIVAPVSAPNNPIAPPHKTGVRRAIGSTGQHGDVAETHLSHPSRANRRKELLRASPTEQSQKRVHGQRMAEGAAVLIFLYGSIGPFSRSRVTLS